VQADDPALALGLRSGDGFQFLSVPFSKPLQADYLPAVLGHSDYPGMVETGHDVNTIAASAVLIAYNWPKDSDRYRRIANFVNAFFPKIAALQKPPHHPKWRETNLAAVLPGWTRFAGADEWLAQNRQAQPAATRDQFDQFLAGKRALGTNIGTDSSPEREQLFQQFLQWQARQH